MWLQARIEDLITQNLVEDLSLLKEEELAMALHNFVEKDEKVGPHEGVEPADLLTAGIDCTCGCVTFSLLLRISWVSWLCSCPALNPLCSLP